MRFFKEKYQVVYEVDSRDQDRAAAYVKMICELNKPELLANVAADAQKLFGRAYIINRKTGLPLAVRQFEDPAPIVH